MTETRVPRAHALQQEKHEKPMHCNEKNSPRVHTVSCN